MKMPGLAGSHTKQDVAPQLPNSASVVGFMNPVLKCALIPGLSSMDPEGKFPYVQIPCVSKPMMSSEERKFAWSNKERMFMQNFSYRALSTSARNIAPDESKPLVMHISINVPGGHFGDGVMFTFRRNHLTMSY